MPHAISINNPISNGVELHGDWRDDLMKKGYAVVKSALTVEKTADYVTRMFDWLESFPFGFDRSDPSTWTPEHLPAHIKGGMYHGYAVQHERFVWEARQEPGVLGAFAKLWQTRELLVSFDGINITLPGSDSAQTKPWPHIDQSPQRPGLACVQGIINLSPNGPTDGGLVVLEGSHILTEEFFRANVVKENESGTSDWYLFNNNQIEWFRHKGCKTVKVCADAGDLILWDSRTIHYNVPPQGNRVRALLYACYAPAQLATPETLKTKRKLFEERQGTTHWPHENIFASSGNNLRLGKLDPYHRESPREEPELTEGLLRLAGAVPY